MYRTRRSSPHLILGGKPHRSKQKGTSSQNTPPYCCYGYIYIFTTKRRFARERWKMKFTCNTKDIASAVGAASKVVNAHTTVPILSNVLLQADDGKIAVRATDLELTLEHAFPAEIGEGGSVTDSRQAFLELSRNLARRDARAYRNPDARQRQVRTQQLRFPRAAGRRVSAAAGRHPRLALHDCREEVPRRHRRGRSLPPRTKRRAAPC